VRRLNNSVQRGLSVYMQHLPGRRLSAHLNPGPGEENQD
jgi:hypothetical protein